MHTEEKQQHSHPQDWSWRFWFTVPLYPYGQRRTIRKEVVPDMIWTFDQQQGVLYVTVPIRMTVVKLAAGGLLIYAPVAPTPECIRLVNELVALHGDVKYIILPTASGIEHKAFVGPFARQFRQAQVFVSPHQWSFPVNLPLSWLGFPLKRTHRLPDDSRETPFADEFDYALLGPIDLRLGIFEEVALFHRRSRTLLVTDSVISIPEDPPEIVQLDPYPLLFHARDNALEPVIDSPANRRKGWQRISLFSFYFRPSALGEVKVWQSIRQAMKAPDRSRKAYFGWFPFHWQQDWRRSFEALRGNGRLFVAPILQQLILNRAPKATLAWADQVAHWEFERIIPCHFDAPVTASPQQFRQAFSFLEQRSVRQGEGVESLGYPLPEADFALLRSIDQDLHRFGIVPPPEGKV